MAVRAAPAGVARAPRGDPALLRRAGHPHVPDGHRARPVRVASRPPPVPLPAGRLRRGARGGGRAGAVARDPAVDAPGPVHGAELRGRARAAPRRRGARGAGRAARRDGARAGRGRRAARRRRRGRQGGGDRPVPARLRAALGRRARPARGGERRPHVRAARRAGGVVADRASRRVGHPAPPLQRPGPHPRPRGARAGARDVAAGRAAEDPLLVAADRRRGAQGTPGPARRCAPTRT